MGGKRLKSASTDPIGDMILGRDTARVDIPLIRRRSLRDAAEIMHQVANTLTRLSLDGPGETLSDRSALVLAQNAIYGAQAAMRKIKDEDTAERKREAVPKWGVERVDSNGTSKA